MDAANPKPARQPAIFSAEIRPHRSLSPHGFLLLMGLVGCIAFLAGLVFLMIGAWPVVGFLGLDVALIWWAFRANYRAARAREMVDVTDSDVLVRRIEARGGQTEWHFNPYWVRLQIERDADDEIRQLALTSHGRRLEIAAWLSPPERADFASALSQALSIARRGTMPA